MNRGVILITVLPSGKTMDACLHELPMLKDIMATKEVFWINPRYDIFKNAIKNISLNEEDVQEAENRLVRFAPLISKLFPETKASNGIIESPMYKVPNMKSNVEKLFNVKILGEMLLKCDSNLPIAGSIKARGGICATSNQQ